MPSKRGCLMSAEAAHRHTAACYRRSARALCILAALSGVAASDEILTEAVHQFAIASMIARNEAAS